MTPLIDIVFLLLIFFLVSTQFADEDNILDVQLPTAAEAQPLIANPKALFININEKGQFFLGKQQVDADDLRRQIEQAAINNPTTQSAVVRADRRCDWQHVASAFEICQRAGIDVRPSTQPDGG